MRAVSLSQTTVDHVGRVIATDDGPSPVLLLGAGASVKSGIPSAGDLAAMAVKWAYCERHGFAHQDPQVTRSDWLPWLRGLSWFDGARLLAVQYPTVIEQLLRPRENRRGFFLEALRRRAALSRGYPALGELAVRGRTRTILTTNFDQLIPTALARPELRHVELIETPQVDLRQLSTDPIYPQVVFLHGSVAHYSDQNLEQETARLDPDLRDQLRPLLRDHPLIVVGYRGAERSIMVDLLLDGTDDTHGYAHGIYWCARSVQADDLDALVLQLADRIGTNFQLVAVDGFDECMTEWATISAARAPTPRELSLATPPVRDMRRSTASLDDLDWDLIAERLQEYAERLGQQPLAGSDRTKLIERLIALDLAVEHDGEIVPTNAAELLFSRGEPIAAELRHDGAVLPLRGNLFSVLRRLSDMVDEVNAPFRLKGAVSHDVRSYEPAAIKEVLVNALAHRDHSDPSPVRVTIDNARLEVKSCGGLVPPLTPERLGQPGEKAYRNPVVADILYGTGLMDKAGSGLADVRRWSRAAGGDVSLGVVDNNTAFLVALIARAEHPDPRTGTADPGNVERFLSNMLPIRIDAPVAWIARCPERYAPDILARHTQWTLPAFALQGGELWTFSDVSAADNPLSGEIYGEARQLTVAELEADPDQQRVLVQLLNWTFVNHMESLGLVVHRLKQRCWFPNNDGDERKVTYQARVRQPTRTVTKPLPERRDGTRRWEHESIGYSFRRYGTHWVLHIVPGWVFTHDGDGDMLRGPGVGKLATKRAARDYNQQVSNHLYFWLWVIARGQDVASIDPHVGAVSVEGHLLSYDSLGAPSPLGPPGEARAADDDEQPHVEAQAA